MRISDWISDVCSSDLDRRISRAALYRGQAAAALSRRRYRRPGAGRGAARLSRRADARRAAARYGPAQRLIVFVSGAGPLPHPTVQHNDLGGGAGEWAGAAPGVSEAEAPPNIKLQRRATARKRGVGGKG